MNAELQSELAFIGQRVQEAANQLAIATTSDKNAALLAMAASIRQSATDILTANADDIEHGMSADLAESFIDRLRLDDSRIEGIACGIEKIAELPDPVGKVLTETIRPNGLRIEKVATPIGVIGVIFESRPNVTADAAALCLKSGNGVVLRGGSAAMNSNAAIFNAMRTGLNSVQFDADVIQLIPTTDRAAVGIMLAGMNGGIDVIIPRGGKSLVERVQNESKVPVFAHLEGICHTYVHHDADISMAAQIVENAKMRRTGICGATETILIDKQLPPTAIVQILKPLSDRQCEIRGDLQISNTIDFAIPASDEDWSTEYLDSIVSVKIVEDVESAVQHIERFGTNHTEAIITQDQEIADLFLAKVTSAIVMHNTSTQFADGGEFGMGAEIGIATGKLHARGPVGIEQLTTFKYIVRGNGQLRP